jgi:PKD repeat protein
MRRKSGLKYLVWALVLLVVIASDARGAAFATPTQTPPVPPVIDTSPPEETPKLIFVHASIGEAWLGSGAGKLGSSRDNNGHSLMENNYFVSDYNTHNHPELPGHDYCAWLEVFGDPSWMDVLLDHNSLEGVYDRLDDPGGQNDIVMIKPCATQYPIYGAPDDPPGGECPEVGANWTVGEVKQAMLDTLDYLSQYPDTFFVLVTAPPLCNPDVYGCDGSYDPIYSGANPRAVADWMVNDLLDEYHVGNVMVFDLYNALTSNHEGEGDACPEDVIESDAGMEAGNHHRVWGDQVEHQVGYDQNYSAYCTGHPKEGGLYKATQEFVPLLNAYYNAWVAGQGQTTANFTADPRTGEAPLSVQFTDTSTGDPTAWTWDFGDQSSASYDQHPAHAYTAPGSYTVTLTVTGTVSTDTNTIVRSNYITVTPTLLQADFTAQPRLGLAPLAVQFTDQSQGDVLTHTWRFGDDTTSLTRHPTHTYSVTGRYTVTLIAENAYGSDTVMRSSYIHVVDVIHRVYLPTVLRD